MSEVSYSYHGGSPLAKSCFFFQHLPSGGGSERTPHTYSVGGGGGGGRYFISICSTQLVLNNSNSRSSCCREESMLFAIFNFKL